MLVLFPALVIGGAVLELSRQNYVIRHGGTMCYYHGGVRFSNAEDAEVLKVVAFGGRRIYRGPFVIAEYFIDFTPGTDQFGRYNRSRGVIPGGVTVEFLPPLPYEEEYYDYGIIYRDVIPAIGGDHIFDRTHFIGQISIRREILWTILGLASATLLWVMFSLLAMQRRLKRFSRGLCVRCRYPLPAPVHESPRCPECGTPHAL